VLSGALQQAAGLWRATLPRDAAEKQARSLPQAGGQPNCCAVREPV